MRSSDRIEGTLRLLVIVIMLAMVPVAGAFGTARYTGALEQIRSENAAKTQVSATVLDKPVAAGNSGPYRAADLEAPVRWTRDGDSGQATVTVPDTAAIGSTLPVWLGRDGKPTTAPRPPAAAVSSGIGAAVAILLLSSLCGLAVVCSVDLALGARRHAQWDSEWRGISRPIGT
ncbi:hypothetical protein GFY24_35205 [Nocardia sp. SYP-A9097]|uniref:Rv1733c family protein n=1 Tax=Nocardia sp. SYP-A9097 TaxID=2663237 RepID=UPI00129B0BB0|nr:hypothetical protein [Nocardia sp. SYP-A9097]MRH92611.1 hypothetical protein [Nocardia sp. SYP-A9097]